ncbi:hypothetical protein QJQ45_024492, partial [Haematococcus lacustris]
QDWQQQRHDWQQRQQDWLQQQQLLEKQLHDLLQRADIHAHIIVVSAANELARLKEQLNVAQARLAHQASGAEQLQQSVVRLTAAVCAADARAVAAEASSIAAAAVAADASSDAHASAALLEQERQLNAALLEHSYKLVPAFFPAPLANLVRSGCNFNRWSEETELLHQHVAIADAATKAAMADAEDKGVRLRAFMADSKQLQKECSNLMKRVARRQVYNRQQPHLPALPQKGITLNHLKQLCVRLNLATKGTKSRIQCLEAISQHQQQQHQQAPAVAALTPLKRHAPDSVMRMR